MKTALDIYVSGKQKEVNADEYDHSRYHPGVSEVLSSSCAEVGT